MFGKPFFSINEEENLIEWFLFLDFKLFSFIFCLNAVVGLELLCLLRIFSIFFILTCKWMAPNISSVSSSLAKMFWDLLSLFWPHSASLFFSKILRIRSKLQNSSTSSIFISSLSSINYDIKANRCVFFFCVPDSTGNLKLSRHSSLRLVTGYLNWVKVFTSDSISEWM